MASRNQKKVFKLDSFWRPFCCTLIIEIHSPPKATLSSQPLHTPLDCVLLWKSQEQKISPKFRGGKPPPKSIQNKSSSGQVLFSEQCLLRSWLISQGSRQKFMSGFGVGFWASRGQPVKNFGQALQILEQQALWHGHAARMSMAKLQLWKLRAIFVQVAPLQREIAPKNVEFHNEKRNEKFEKKPRNDAENV